MGSPPAAGSKKVVLKFRSIRRRVIPPAKTGRERRSKKAVMRTAQTNKGSRCIVNPGALILKIVVIKFTAPNKEETPAK
jgi:hypothetical protein